MAGDARGSAVAVEDRTSLADPLAQFWGPNRPVSGGRVLGLFAHPDDEVFCVGGSIALCAQAGAHTTIVSLTQGEAGQIRDSAVATRRTLGTVRAGELASAGSALGVDRTQCLQMGDGTLAGRPLEEVAAIVRGIIDEVRPDVVVTFDPTGAYDHPDHVTSCLATMAAISEMADPPRLLHAVFPPRRDLLLLDLLVDWLTSKQERFTGTAAFGIALKLFADGSSMLGFAADHLHVDWFPAGTLIIEQGEPAKELLCILSGTVDIAVESAEGELDFIASLGPGSFIGQDGLATASPRNANVIAHEDVTCLVFSPQKRDTAQGRGVTAAASRTGHIPEDTKAAGETESAVDPESSAFAVDVTGALSAKIRALAAHRSQYALDESLLPLSILQELLGTERFVVASQNRG